ncbi:TrmH family RNA methyltransferase [Mongoliibacter ruber]|uniref:tRNA (guanosine(18)-2'-O)-methyltransferase n=1 Tax=Mongoliibacter ruber TaxID=1750599 RepID=A0A2T0WUU1_9BACT|nr:RNA methyltransferase [Mongoliibacter ruber]PRY90455.1 tRNA (guanosine-2'-O-)-methyltransferase [Mongoliibacter ruber]
MDQNTELAFLEYLKTYITPHKIKLMDEILSKRTRYFTVVLEDIFKPHNASAVLRTADCFGIQDVHVIEKTNTYKINPYVTRGASQWVDLHRYGYQNGSGVMDCFDSLRSKGYKIYATSPVADSININDLKPDHPMALVFGNEHEGVSDEVISQSDGLVHIPMHGFTESFNISVTASIFLFDLLRKVKEYAISDFYISESEKANLRSKWYRGLVKQVDIHEKEFLRKIDMEI